MNTRSTLATAHELAGEISTLYAHINAATFTLLEKIREFDDLQLYGDLNCRSTAHWLNYACGIGLGAGREKVRVAHALATLPEIESAFRGGRVSYSKVRALTRVATAENETHFLNIAYHSTASQTERIVRNHQNVIAASESDTFTRRSLEFLWLSDGSLSFKGRLSADQGALFLKALDQAFLENEGRDFYAVLDRKEPVNAKRADALMVVTERAMAADPVSSASADRYQVTVHVNADTLLGQFQHDDPPQVENGPVLTVKTAERLTCDASIVPMLESAAGEPLKIGRKTRIVSTGLRRALKRRDKGCRFPGCEQTHYVDAHHIHHWAHGGETNLENLVLLCRYHHRHLHEGGYAIEKEATKIRFTDPSGIDIPTVADDLSQGSRDTLMKSVPAGTLLAADSLTPEMDWRPPDYHHIAWVLAQIA